MRAFDGDNRYIIIAIFAIFFVFLCYVAKFYFGLGYQISDNPSEWAELGDYLGGILGPLLSFFSIVLLIKSLRLQNAANESLREDLRNSEKTEKLRSFEALFFHMIESQKELFKFFFIKRGADSEADLRGVEAVLWIEQAVELLCKTDELRTEEDCAAAVRKLIDDIDVTDQIFGISRAFYIIVKLITEKLGDDRGFCVEDRKSHLLALVNFTDYAHLRLILICVQFTARPSVEYLRENSDFVDVINEVGLQFDPY
jgi:hypothetical protein